MTNDSDNLTPSGSDPTDSTVDDWFGQDVQRDAEAAEQAMQQAGGDENEAAEIFEKIKPEHKGDRYNVAAEDRPQ